MQVKAQMAWPARAGTAMPRPYKSGRTRGSGALEFLDRRNHASDLLALELRKHRQRENFLCGTLRLREVTRAVAKQGINGLQVERNRVVNGAADVALGQKLLERVATGNANRVLMKDVLRGGGHSRSCDARDFGQELGVFGGVLLTGALPLRQVGELYAKNRGLYFVKATVEAGLAADVFGGLAVIAEGAEARGDVAGVGDGKTGVAVGAEIFRWIETEAADIAEGAGWPPFVRGADGLRGVLDNGEIAGAGEGEDGRHVGEEAIEVDRNDRASALSDAAFELGGIEIESSRVDVSEDGFSTDGADGAGGGYKGEGREEDFVTGLYTAGAKSKDERIGAGCEADAMSDATELRDFGLERSPFVAEYELV